MPQPQLSHKLSSYHTSPVTYNGGLATTKKAQAKKPTPFNFLSTKGNKGDHFTYKTRSVKARKSNKKITTSDVDIINIFTLHQAQLEKKYITLKEAWKEKTGFSSNTIEKSMCLEYQEIIGLGKEVLPLILRDLEKSPDHWFWALRSITGENPIPEEDLGNTMKMSEHWLNWGRDKNLV